MKQFFMKEIIPAEDILLDEMESVKGGKVPDCDSGCKTGCESGGK